METIERMIDDAIGHIDGATRQMVASDDQIICNHVRDGLVSLKIARGELKGIQEVNGEMLKALKAVDRQRQRNRQITMGDLDMVASAIAKAEGKD